MLKRFYNSLVHFTWKDFNFHFRTVDFFVFTKYSRTGYFVKTANLSPPPPLYNILADHYVKASVSLFFMPKTYTLSGPMSSMPNLTFNHIISLPEGSGNLSIFPNAGFTVVSVVEKQPGCVYSPCGAPD